MASSASKIPVSRSLRAARRVGLQALVAATCLATLGGCIVAAVGAGALGGAVVMTDRRSSGIQLEDKEIEHRVNSALEDHFARTSVRIDVSAYDQDVLLAGQVPSEQDRLDAAALAARAENVRHVSNELEIGSMAGLSSGTDDALLATKVRTALLEEKGMPPGVIVVHCTLGSIYLMGKVSAHEAEVGKAVASHVEGVKRVVALFEILSPEEHAQYPAQKP